MVVKKYPHSNLVVSTPDYKIMIDPGFITFEKGYRVSDFSDIDAFLITHSHPDHLDPQTIKQLSEGKPIYGNSDVVAKLQEMGVPSTEVKDRELFSVGPFKVEPVFLPHCKMADGTDGPPNTGFLIDNVFFHPGDGIGLANFTAPNLALPIAGPTVRYQDALNFAKSLNASLVIPIHYDSKFAADPKEFAELVSNQNFKVQVLNPGEQIEI